MTELTSFRLKSLFNYQPETGLFTRIITVSSNARSGDVIKHQETQGYVELSIDGKRYRAHRLAWLYVHGVWPEGFIDHINGIRHDNRISNLRLATDTQNKHNANISERNTSGVKGVSWAKRENKWYAQLRANGKTHSLGYFSDLSKASEVVMAERTRLHGEFANHGINLRKEAGNGQ